MGYSINYYYLNNEFPNFLKSYDITSKYDGLVDAYVSGVSYRIGGAAAIFLRSLLEGYYNCLKTNYVIYNGKKSNFESLFVQVAKIIQINQSSVHKIINMLSNDYKHTKITEENEQNTQNANGRLPRNIKPEEVVCTYNNLIGLLGKKIYSNILNCFILDKSKTKKNVKVIKKTQKVKIKEYVDPTKKIDVRENKYDRSAEGQDRRISNLKTQYGNTSFFDFRKKKEINQKIKQAKNNKKQLREKSYQCNKSRITSLYNERKKCIDKSESKGFFGKIAKTFNNLANDEQKRKANFNAKLKYQKEKIRDFLSR